MSQKLVTSRIRGIFFSNIAKQTYINKLKPHPIERYTEIIILARKPDKKNWEHWIINKTWDIRHFIQQVITHGKSLNFYLIRRFVFDRKWNRWLCWTGKFKNEQETYYNFIVRKWYL